MKRLLLATAICALCTTAMAQNKEEKKFNFSAGAELGIATSDFSLTHSIGIGATIQAENNVAKGTNITLTTGYLTYNGKSAGAGIKYKAAGIIPLKAGVKFFLSEGFYGAAQLGAGFFSGWGNGAAFAYTPVLGYEFNTKSGTAVDASFKYDGYAKNGTSLGSVGVRVAYRF
ncbi:MAG: hypothetical protein JST86_04150 [Bacteroidetes bacterium]|nr:hypothetical protein [Bacteroidota bacterium]